MLCTREFKWSCNKENGTVQEYGCLKSAWTNECVLPQSCIYNHIHDLPT